ncbi:MAG: hypothetical protein B6245_14545 [Desulfobacteraceae bacterium 4572_88]|nr:MAG: hypothetical protein B6245_14545 [Desulfobacteraceae bacterium 4572_88]
MEAIGILAGGIAHDFNNLLTIIMGNIELAQYVIPPDGEADETLSAAFSACGRASELTQKFLTLSKGGAPIMTKGSLEELIREMIPGRFTGTDIRCELSVPDDLWNAEFDTAQMGQVFDHIIANACEAMPEAEISGFGRKTPSSAQPLRPRKFCCKRGGGTSGCGFRIRGPALPRNICTASLIPIFPPNALSSLC